MFSWFGVTILSHRDNETDHRDIQWHNGPNQSNLMSTKLSSRSECSLPINKSLKEFMDWKGMDLVGFELACVSELISIKITDVIIMMIRTISSYEQYHHTNNIIIWTMWWYEQYDVINMDNLSFEQVNIVRVQRVTVDLFN